MIWQEFVLGNPLCWLWIKNMHTGSEWLFMQGRWLANQRVDNLEQCGIYTQYMISSLDSKFAVGGTTAPWWRA